MLNNFSPNMLKIYQTCPRKYYYQYIENVQVPKSSIPFEKGKKIHALANYFLRRVNINRIETALSVSEKQTWETLLNNQYFKMECFQSEYTLSCKVGNYWIGGRLDAVVKEGENYYILDYKTGSVPKNPQYDFQTMVYLLCLDKIVNSYETLSFVYINLKEDKNYLIEFSPELRTVYENLIIEACDKIVSDTVYECDETSCARCEYSKLCEFLK